MKLEKAYSQDLKRTITPEDADYNFSSGKISSKYAFTCPDENCDAAVTCANLDKEKSQRKIPPYYRVVGEHNINCLINQAITEKNNQKAEPSDIYSENDVYISNAVRLDLRLASNQQTKTESSINLEENILKSEYKTNLNKSNKRMMQPTNTVSSLVSSFLNKEKKTVQIPKVGTLLPIEEFFIEINGQDIHDFDDEYRIYFGLAWFNKIDGKGFVVRFDNKLKYSELEVRPSFFISLSTIGNSPYAKFSLENMNNLCDKYPKRVFILSETSPNVKDNKYINFWLDGLQYMDYRLE
ncbi:hypothetical protein C7375_11826 [Frischella perrara]|uniref:Uncharacterized protein n=1 Tax=Frischella perrara TaxID=1267021 RepID=A0A0A7S3A9_FRIPE|nr:hypothetical protein [Frischella perrara]AJA45959.1 hypothetical protein FPB0191_02153 [Frischella perrara]PWV58562.1 hypothetical protein C7375_11826 [Frischella perrara]